jgi:(p)ppGpp synthase/HD superfamily hydrolase
MVAVLNKAPQTAAPDAVAAWLATLAADYSSEERAAFAAAFEYARAHTGDAAMADGEAALDRALGTATILGGLKLDADSIRSALLLGLPVAGTFDAE